MSDGELFDDLPDWVGHRDGIVLVHPDVLVAASPELVKLASLLRLEVMETIYVDRGDAVFLEKRPFMIQSLGRRERM